MRRSEKDLVIGQFYWVTPVMDPDIDFDWENELQPAKYAGDGYWFYLNIEGVSRWPVRYVGNVVKVDDE